MTSTVYIEGVEQGRKTGQVRRYWVLNADAPLRKYIERSSGRWIPEWALIACKEAGWDIRTLAVDPINQWIFTPEVVVHARRGRKYLVTLPDRELIDNLSYLARRAA